MTDTNLLIATGTLIVAVLGTGVTLAMLIVPGQREMRRDIAELRERMARLEGLFQGFTKRPNASDAD